MKKQILLLILIFGFKTIAQNHAPVFVKEMPDTFILAGKTLLFQYKATDQDGDSISYSVKSVLPMNATLLPKTGVFLWRPTNSQQGKYELIVSASDGKLSTDSRKIIIETTYLWDDFGSGSLTINVSHGIGGEVEKHINNDTALVRAIPYKGYRFTSWTEKGIIVSTDSIYKFRITVSRDLLANFRINHAPVFVKEMPDTTNLLGKNFVFTYKAIDPDGDSIKYYASPIFPTKAVVMASSGVFGWRSSSLDLRHNYIQVYATDGFQSTFSKTAVVDVQGPTCCIEGFSLAIQTKPLNGGVIIREIKNDTISLKAIENKGFKFSSWKEYDSLLSINPSYSFTFKSNIFSSEYKNIYAYFTEGSSIEQCVNLPTNFRLEQNFPNPFNPETTISYSLPKGEYVTLKVYDVLGREVATLVDEYKQTGAYKSNFNASGLVSGVYFYQLSAGNYVQTKKLILMK